MKFSMGDIQVTPLTKANFMKIYGMKTTIYLTAHIKYYRVFYSFPSISVKFITEDDKKKNIPNESEFRENRRRESHTLCMVVNKFLSVLSTLNVRYG